MKKNNKKDLLNIFFLTILFILIIIYILRDGTLYGSTLDWINQHSRIPEYFRTLFYETHNLFPDFAFNLGSGQNIYNFAYYGYLNPVIMLSYLLPFIPMELYIEISSILIVYISIIMFYYFLRLNNYNENICLISSLSFLLASPLIFHSHRHIMFINYMPFLILALFGVDLYFKNNKKTLLCLSTTLIILMSYYYSIPSIICIVLYGIYKYISINKKITFKKFIYDGFIFLLPIIIGILISSILLFPVFISLLSGRVDSVNTTNIYDLIIPSINIKYLMYYAYGLGLTSIALISLIVLLFTKKRENKFLGVVLSLLIVFPLFNYILNATMYIDAKVLIPFLPLYVYAVSECLKNIIEEKINKMLFIFVNAIVLIIVYLTKSNYLDIFYKDYVLTLSILILGMKIKNKNIFYIILILFLLFINCKTIPNNKLVPYDRYYSESNINQKKLSNKIPNDYNHTTLYNNNHDNVNSINENINIYSSYIYSSISNSYYNKFYFDIFNNTMQYRNRALLAANKNIMYLMFSNNKYFISDKTDIVGYSPIASKANTYLYENNDVLPFMYVSYNFMSNRSFDNYKFPYTNEILLNKAIIDKDMIDEYETNIKKATLNNFRVINVDDNISINSNVVEVNKSEGSILIDLDDNLKDKILFISFDLEPQKCSKGDLAIKINDELNTLTCYNWKYYNGNTSFNYVLSESYRDNIELTFIKGKYVISNLSIYYMSYNDIKDVNKKVTKVNIDSKIKDNKIYASVDAIKDGYFITTIPYDKGFTIKVDDKTVDYEIVNKAFIGFKISKGHHNIEMVYHAPLKRIGTIFSIIGIVLFIILIKNKKEKSK